MPKAFPILPVLFVLAGCAAKDGAPAPEVSDSGTDAAVTAAVPRPPETTRDGAAAVAETETSAPDEDRPPLGISLGSRKAGAVKKAAAVEDLANEVAGTAASLIREEIARLPKSDRPPRDGLEGVAGWAGQEWGHRATARVGQLPVGAKKNKLLRLACSGGTREKAAFSLPLRAAMQQAATVRARVCNVGAVKVDIAFAVKTGETFAYYESKAKRLPPGVWTNLEADFGEKAWKCEATKWKHESAVVGAQDVREVLLLVYNKFNTVVYVDELFFSRARLLRIGPAKKD